MFDSQLGNSGLHDRAVSFLRAPSAGLLGAWSDGTGPAYRSLAERLRLLIADGRIMPGSRVPSERELTDALGVSRTTVASAYRELRDAGT